MLVVACVLLSNGRAEKQMWTNVWKKVAKIVNKCVKLQINVTDASAITVTKKVQNFDDMAKITVVDRFLKTLLMII